MNTKSQDYYGIHPRLLGYSRPTLGLTASLFSLLLIAALLLPHNTFALDRTVKPSLPFTVPLPPPRPERPPESHGVSTPPAAAAPTAASLQEVPRQSRYLPSASRARMHACGVEWQKLKETGLAADKTWYEFAQVCLAK
jgi:hypothetical protein